MKENPTSLLALAKSVKREPNPDAAKLAVAWAAGEVTLKQVMVVLKKTGSSYAFLASGLRDALTLGLLVRK